MNLQNIAIDFDENKVTSLFEDKHYTVDVFENVQIVEQSFKDSYGVDFTKVIVQLSEDQHMCEPRILCQTENSTEFITIQDVVTNHPELFSDLRNIRVLIEEQVSNQLITA